jgi:hypothetical protein
MQWTAKKVSCGVIQEGFLDKNSFESNSSSLGYAKKGGAMFVQWLLLLSR